MFDKFKISLILLAGIALSLGACNNTDSDRSTPNTATHSPSPSAPVVSKTPEMKARAPLSRSVPSPDTRKLGEAQRSNYKPVPLEKVAVSGSLKGTDPQAIALQAFGNTQSEGGSRTVTLDYPQLDRAVVNITQTGVADDSVGGIRYRVEFAPHSGSSPTVKQWEMVWAGSQVKCHLGRGHQDWSTENCR